MRTKTAYFQDNEKLKYIKLQEKPDPQSSSSEKKKIFTVTLGTAKRISEADWLAIEGSAGDVAIKHTTNRQEWPDPTDGSSARIIAPISTKEGVNKLVNALAEKGIINEEQKELAGAELKLKSGVYQGKE